MDYEKFKKEYETFENFVEEDEPRSFLGSMARQIQKADRVNSPSHYTSGKVEAIDTIEDAIKDAPSVDCGFLQGQVLKYLLRIWLKDNPLEDARKARWYLERLISKLAG